MSRFGSKTITAATDILVNDASDDGIFYSARITNTGANEAWVVFLNSAGETAAADLKGFMVPAGESVPVTSAVALGAFIRAFSTGGTTLSWQLIGNNPVRSVPIPSGSHFIFDIDTTETGSSTNLQFQLPLVSAGALDFTLFHDDLYGSPLRITAFDQFETLLDFLTGGVKTGITCVANNGTTISGWKFDNSDDEEKFLDVSNCGPLELSEEDAFYGCVNLVWTATDAPIISTTSLVNTFLGCSLFNGVIDNWDVSAVTNMAAMFQSAAVFNQSIDSWDVSAVTDMSNMFNDADAYNQSMNSWNVEAVLNMHGMFENNSGFNGNIADWTPLLVTDMSSMFQNATAFNQDIDSWNVSAVTNMASMFNTATSFNQDLNSWDVGAVLALNNMFRDAPAFNGNIVAWTPSVCTRIDNMFRGSIFNQDISGWDVSAVTDMTSTFQSVTTFDQDLGAWDITALTTAANMFNGVTLSTRNYESLLVGWQANTHNNTVTFDGGNSKYASGASIVAKAALDPGDSWTITDGGVNTMTLSVKTDNTGDSNNDEFQLPLVLAGAINFDVIGVTLVGSPVSITAWDDAATLLEFTSAGTHSITIVPNAGNIEGWKFNNGGDKSKLLDISVWGAFELSESDVFEGCSNFTGTATDVPIVTTINFNAMFKFTTNLVLANLGDWDVSAVTDMRTVFEFSGFNQPLDNWDVGAVTNFTSIFRSSSSFNQDLNSWNVTSAINMNSMFRLNSVFNGDISSWNPLVATGMQSMFVNASSFNQDIGSWDVSSVGDMGSMFSGASVFNQDIDSWNVENVTLMAGMFASASAFNQSIDSWNVSGVTDMTDMFNNADAYNQSMNSWNVEAVLTMHGMFENNSGFNGDISGWTPLLCTNFSSMFANATAFDKDLGAWDIVALTNATLMFDGVTLSTPNYDSLLIGWEANAHNNTVTFDGGDSEYTEGAVDAGTTDATTANKLEDSTQDFISTVTIGDVIHNTTDDSFALVTAIDSNTVLSISADIMTTGETYVVQGAESAKSRARLDVDDSWVITDAGAA